MSDSFVHLHNHTEYSLLDGAMRIPSMVKAAKEMGMPALAITDHGVMFGVMGFAMECAKQGIKPLIGMEAYVAPNGLHNKQGREENQTYHLLLLAKNMEGYRNLCKLHTVAALQGFYYKPRIDHEILKAHAEGLIGTSACLGGEICQALEHGQYDRAQYIAGMYKEIFDEGSFFIELQDHGLPEQRMANPQLARIAKELKLPMVCTNDAHYLCKGDSEPHDVLLCVGTGALLHDEKRLRFETPEFYIKSPEEMSTLFAEYPEAIENTLLAANMCDLELGKDRALMPDPELPEGETPRTYLRKVAEAGLKERVKQPGEADWERLEYELGVIETTGYESYFLLVREFADFTRSQGIMFGVRGSAAGSLVSYTVGITDVNPLEYGLTFERFLNPERVSMPDIDMDFEDARRDEVIKWVTERYGQERVAQIVTFGTLGAKAAMRDAGRVMGYAPIDVDRVCKTIPNGPGWSIERAQKEVAEFRQAVEADPKIRVLVDTAQRIEGLSRHCGVHAAGVVISRDPLDNHIPLYRGSDGQAITAFEMGILEKIGMLKMDFLGLSNLTVLAKAVSNIRQTHADVLDKPKELAKHPVLTGGHHAIPFDDKKTYERLSAGDTVGVFQLESGGMRRNIVALKPQNVGELSAMVALYRPGPMEHIPRYVESKFGRTKVQYLDEKMRPILEETYGVIVYQDQVLLVLRALAGFSLGKADVLRRAMGKKDRNVMDSMQGEFITGCETNGVSREVADQVWELLLPFAGYAFNKAHAVCYGILAYQTGYLKANYPAEYMAALLAVYRTREDKVTTFIEECRRQKIPVLPPDVNRSQVDFTIEIEGNRKAIRFGLGAIKGVGEGLIEHLIEERAQGPFTNLFEFCERTRSHGMNKGALEALVKSGALDGIEPNRNKLRQNLEQALSFADNVVRQRSAGQHDLFGDGEPGTQLEYPTLPEADAPARSDILAMEKEVLGIYVSDHPLRGYERAVSAQSSATCAGIQDLDDGTQVRIAGVIAGVRTIVTRSKGEKMATVTLEDLSGQATCTVFPATYAKFRDLIEKDTVVGIKGVVSHRERMNGGRERTIEVRVDDISRMEPLNGNGVADDEAIAGTVVLRLHQATHKQLQKAHDLMQHNPGDYEVLVQLASDTPPLVLLNRVDPNPKFLKALGKSLPSSDVDVVSKAALLDFAPSYALAAEAEEE